MRDSYEVNRSESMIFLSFGEIWDFEEFAIRGAFDWENVIEVDFQGLRSWVGLREQIRALLRFFGLLSIVFELAIQFELFQLICFD